jgi:hypothetical protein
VTKSYLLKHTVRCNHQSATQVTRCDLEATFTRNALMSDRIVAKSIDSAKGWRSASSVAQRPCVAQKIAKEWNGTHLSHSRSWSGGKGQGKGRVPSTHTSSLEVYAWGGDKREGEGRVPSTCTSTTRGRCMGW